MKKKRKKRKVRRKARIQIRKQRIYRKAKKSSKREKKSKKTKKLRISLKKLKAATFVKAIKPKFKFSFKSLLKKIISPLIKELKNLKKSRERLELKKKQDF